MQLVNLVEGGDRARMSKRRGEFVTLDELIDIGADAARFFLLQREPDHAVDLDLDLARTTSQDNPVYYVPSTRTLGSPASGARRPARAARQLPTPRRSPPPRRASPRVLAG